MYLDVLEDDVEIVHEEHGIITLPAAPTRWESSAILLGLRRRDDGKNSCHTDLAKDAESADGVNTPRRGA